jgi:hypothetical protein
MVCGGLAKVSGYGGDRAAQRDVEGALIHLLLQAPAAEEEDASTATHDSGESNLSSDWIVGRRCAHHSGAGSRPPPPVGIHTAA